MVSFLQNKSNHVSIYQYLHDKTFQIITTHTEILVFFHRHETFENLSTGNTHTLKACTSTYYWKHTSRFQRFINFQEVPLILKQIIFRTRFYYINQMIRNRTTIDDIVFQVLSGSQIHTPVHLPTVTTDYLRLQFAG